METTYTKTHTERLRLIQDLMTNGLWTLIANIPSSKNNYYLFESKASRGETIAINDGPDDFYEDVIYNY